MAGRFGRRRPDRSGRIRGRGVPRRPSSRPGAREQGGRTRCSPCGPGQRWPRAERRHCGDARLLPMAVQARRVAARGEAVNHPNLLLRCEGWAVRRRRFRGVFGRQGANIGDGDRFKGRVRAAQDLENALLGLGLIQPKQGVQGGPADIEPAARARAGPRRAALPLFGVPEAARGRRRSGESPRSGRVATAGPRLWGGRRWPARQPRRRSLPRAAMAAFGDGYVSIRRPTGRAISQPANPGGRRGC